MRKPDSVLLATLGTQPQVITAAFDMLTHKGVKIIRVEIIHTSAPELGIPQILAGLITEFPPSVSVLPVPIGDLLGNLYDDVETDNAGRAAFQTIYRRVQNAKREGLCVHLSIAGGRKTMAVYGMAAAQLLFDDQDCLWHLHSAGDFLNSKRLHPQLGDQVHLVSIPVVQWSQVSPILLDFIQSDDPYEALEQQRARQWKDRLEATRSFVHGSLTPGEERAVAELVRHGLSDAEIAQNLSLSPRTVEGHLRSAYQKAAAHWDLESVDRDRLIALLNFYYTVKENTG